MNSKGEELEPVRLFFISRKRPGTSALFKSVLIVCMSDISHTVLGAILSRYGRIARQFRNAALSLSGQPAELARSVQEE